MNYPLHESFRGVCAGLAFPQTCIVCGKESNSGRPLCNACLETRFLSSARKLFFTLPDSTRCEKCGRPLVSSSVLCTSCRKINLFTAIDKIIPLYSYDGVGQDLLTTWKISGMRGLSWSFAQCLFEVLRNNARLFNYSLIPVPPRPGKLREKGWDQVEELARILENNGKIPVLRCLSRTGGLQQKKLNRIARIENLKGYIRVDSKKKLPPTVIVLDDLMTTGSTLDSCAEALLSAGCTKVYGLTLFFD